jgi:tripeptidyl-peptidase-1
VRPTKVSNSFVPPKQKKTASSYTQARSKRRAPSRRGFFGIDASCSTVITPRCLQQIYDIPSSPARLGGNAITVTGYGGQFVQDADVQVRLSPPFRRSLNRTFVQSFLTQFRPDINSSTTFQVELLDGGLNTQNISEAGLEANLDIEVRGRDI